MPQKIQVGRVSVHACLRQYQVPRLVLPSEPQVFLVLDPPPPGDVARGLRNREMQEQRRERLRRLPPAAGWIVSHLLSGAESGRGSESGSSVREIYLQAGDAGEPGAIGLTPAEGADWRAVESLLASLLERALGVSAEFIDAPVVLAASA